MIIVTGAAGLIGSALIWELNKRNLNCKVLAVDNLKSSEKWKNLSPLKIYDYLEKCDFIDLLRKNSLKDVCEENIDCIVHLGACSSTTETDATYLIENNFNYTKELANYCLKNDIRFIYASSAATYGDGLNGFEVNLEKLHTLQPLNMYGYSKQLFDIWANERGLLGTEVSSGRNILGLKYFNVFGPNEYHKGEMRSLVLKAYEQVVSTGSIKLFKSYKDEYKDGEQLRDFIYVKDAVNITANLINSRVSGILNIGSGTTNSWNQLATYIFEALNIPVNIEYIDMPEYLKPKYQYHTCAVVNKSICKTEFGLKNAVTDYVQNYLVENKHLTL